MADLAAFRERVQALYRTANPYGGRKPTQQDLAEAIGLSRSELSRRLSGKGDVSLTCRDAHAIVQTLVAWGAISSQAEARELLVLVDCPDFTPAQWQSAPLDELTAATPVPTAVKTNLPRNLSSFVGRKRELAALTKLLVAQPLVTITGAGGCGKTRLALEVAGQLQNQFADGIFLIELASLRDPAAVPQLVSRSLGIEEQPGQSLVAQLGRVLAPTTTLLLLDNCEHLTAAVAALLTDLLAACPNLHVLATSRAGLHIADEQVYPLASLSLPQEHDTLAQLAEAEAVQLFVIRARHVRPTFQLTDDTVATVATICRHLDGMPLAIELAAARLQMLSLAQIVAHLDERFRLLTDQRFDVDPRHQTLRALIDWSYDLLSVAEQLLLRHLAAFSGGFTLAAVAAALDQPELDLLAPLTALADKSLIYQTQAEPEPRFSMLETIAEYALLRLRESGAEDVARRGHATYFAQLAAQIEPQLKLSHDSTLIVQLEQEYYNLSAAVTWSLAHEPSAIAALQISSLLWRFWQSSGRLREARRWLDAALASAEDIDVATRATALASAGMMALHQDDLAAAYDLLQSALALSRSLGDEAKIANLLNTLGTVTAQQGNYAQAKSLFEECLAMHRAQGYVAGVGNALNNLGIVMQNLGDLRTAKSLYLQALHLRETLDNKIGTAYTLGNLGDLAEMEGNYPAAQAYHERTLAIFRELGDKWSITTALLNLASIELAIGNYDVAQSLYVQSLKLSQEMGLVEHFASFLEGMMKLANAAADYQRVVVLWGAATAMRRIINYPRPFARETDYAPIISTARAALGNSAFAHAQLTGEMMSQDEAMAYALVEADQPATSPTTYP